MSLTAADLATYLGGEVDTARAEQLLEWAQALCETIVDPLPPGAEAVVIDVAARAYVNPAQAEQETVGPYSVARGGAAGLGGLWLTKQNERILRRLAGGGGAFTIDVMPETAGQNLPPWGYANGISTADAGNQLL